MTQSTNPQFALNGTLAAFFAAGLLAGCGGGGTTTTVVTPPVGSVANYVTTVPAANYTGEKARAFNLLNAERSTCGFGLLAQHPALDASAVSHADYLIINNVITHDEVATNQGFTGTNVNARAAAKGYPSAWVSEVLVSGYPDTAGLGEAKVRTFLSAPYHAAVALSGFRDVGLSVRNPSEIGRSSPSAFVNIDFGYVASAGMQDMASTDVRFYPCEGTTGATPSLKGETPNPVPGRDLGANPIGTPIMVFARQGNTVTITNASMIKVATGAVVQLRAPVSSANDPNGALAKNVAYVAPDAALETSTRYQVTLNGTNNGAAYSRTFTFTTGAN